MYDLVLLNQLRAELRFCHLLVLSSTNYKNDRKFQDPKKETIMKGQVCL